MIKVNRKKAVAITHDRLRIERGPKLAELDIELMRAIETGADTAGIAARKQKLRDLPTVDISKLPLEDLATLDVETALKL